MRFDIVTLFPEMFSGPLTESILKRAQQAGWIETHFHQIRDYTTDRHRTADDAPYGGGAGMVMKAAPLAGAIRAACAPLSSPQEHQHQDDPHKNGGNGDHRDSHNDQAILPVILLSPDGQPFTQAVAEELSRYPRLVLVCGRYEGIDERIRTTLITREISIGDYVITGGELAAMVIIDAVTRLLPGVLDADSTMEESHSDGLLEYPQYTRPAEWEGHSVPPVILSGNHGAIAQWRWQQRLLRTLQRRPDLLETAAARGLLTGEDVDMLFS